MAKLYWRIKVDGKWTWRPATCDNHVNVVGCIHCKELEVFQGEDE